jgi:hypothetical protein
VKGLTLHLALYPIVEYVREGAEHVATISHAAEQQGDLLPARFGKLAVPQRIGIVMANTVVFESTLPASL